MDLPFELGDSVRVKPGIKDVDTGHDIGGWQGRITSIEAEGKEPIAMVE